MWKIIGISTVALLLGACDTQPMSAPTERLSVRSDVVTNLPEGTEVVVSLATSDLASVIGAIFMVQGSGNTQDAYCLAYGLPNNGPLYLHTITLVGGGTDREDLRAINFTFSSEMPPGTKIQITGLYGSNCAGNPLFRAVVVNGS